MDRIEQLRKMIGWDVTVVCDGRETGYRTYIMGTLQENQGTFELWYRGQRIYQFDAEIIDCVNDTPGYRPALFTKTC